MRVLVLFGGKGGGAHGYALAGFEPYCVDLEPSPRNPYPCTKADALDVLQTLLAGGRVGFTEADGARVLLRLEDFVLIHASPPCQLFTAYRRRGAGVGANYPDLIDPVRALLERTGLAWIIENVPGAPLVDPVQLCGSSFGLDVRRHRLFESNLPLKDKPCDHTWQTPRFPGATNRKPNSRCTVEVGVWRIPLEVQQRAMGIDWMTLPELSESVPPAYTEYLGKQVFATLVNEAAAC